MILRPLIPALVALALLWPRPAAAAPGAGLQAVPTVVGGAAAVEAARQTDQREAAARAASRAVADLSARKARLEKTYERQLEQIDRLKREPASWRRDRLVRAQLAKSIGTARRLSALAGKLRAERAVLARSQRSLVAAIDREWATGATAARRALLSQLRSEALRALAPPVRKIVLPDLHIDPLADPEDLDVQSALIRHSERRLQQEAARLALTASRFRRMAHLRGMRARAAELAARDDDGPRREVGRAATPGRSITGGTDNGTGTGGAGGGASAPPPTGGPTEGNPQPPTTNNPSSGQGGFDEPVIVLSDVVDGATLDALRRAGRSSDPAVRARAAALARAQVEKQLQRLRRRRQLIERRAAALRRSR